MYFALKLYHPLPKLPCAPAARWVGGGPSRRPGPGRGDSGVGGAGMEEAAPRRPHGPQRNTTAAGAPTAGPAPRRAAGFVPPSPPLPAGGSFPPGATPTARRRRTNSRGQSSAPLTLGEGARCVHRLPRGTAHTRVPPNRVAGLHPSGCARPAPRGRNREGTGAREPRGGTSSNSAAPAPHRPAAGEACAPPVPPPLPPRKSRQVGDLKCRRSSERLNSDAGRCAAATARPREAPGGGGRAARNGPGTHLTPSM